MLQTSRTIAATAAIGILMGVPAALAEPPKIAIELNKLEPHDKGCKAFLVVSHDGAIEFEIFKLDLILFQRDGVIGKRIAVNLAPIKATKKSVKQFDLEGIACDQIGSILINDILECKSADGPVNDCLQGLTLNSLTNVPLAK